STCAAYGDTAHRNVVRDAFEFIIANKNDSKTKYADGSTPKSDYDLLITILSGNSRSVTDDVLRKIATQLGEESVNTDRLEDVTLKIPTGFLQYTYVERTYIYGVYFTLFSHFINVRMPANLWEHDGYSFRWARQNSKCPGNGDDTLVNIVVPESNAKVDTDKTQLYSQYRDPLKQNMAKEYENQFFKLKIDDVYFWPISHLAKYWFESFLNSPKDLAGTPLKLNHIAPVLHAVADATVPYHAVGLSGCGHGKYETKVDGLYNGRNSLYDPSRVKNFLVDKKFGLNRSNSIIDIVTKDAVHAADPKLCECTIKTCKCPMLISTDAEANAAAKELVNLAIASSVLVLRKGLTEWSKLDTQTAGAPPTPGTFWNPTGPGRVLRFPSFGSIKFGPPTVVAAEPTTAKSIGEKLQGPISKLQGTASNVDKLTAEETSNRLNSAIDELRSVAATIPQWWDPFKLTVQLGPETFVQDPRIEFRLPKGAELESEWSSYSRLYDNFYGAYSLYRIGILIGALEGRSGQQLEPAQKEFTDSYAKALRDRLGVLIEALKPSPGQGQPIIKDQGGN